MGKIGLYQNNSEIRNRSDWKLNTDFVKTFFSYNVPCLLMSVHYMRIIKRLYEYKTLDLRVNLEKDYIFLTLQNIQTTYTI